jgi:hypothetical protein
MDYWFDICHLTKGGHIELLSGMQKELGEFLSPSVRHMLQSCPPFKCMDLVTLYSTTRMLSNKQHVQSSLVKIT